MRMFFAFVRCSVLTGIVWRLNYIFTLVSNLAYIAVVYYLWKSIYRNAPALNGMTFNQAFVYMAAASSIFVLFKTWLEWYISREIISGAITMKLIKPMDYQLTMISLAVGQMVNNIMIITIPSMIVVFAVFKASLPLGWNVLFFLLSLPFACLLSLLIDYIVGLTSFYTESLWGISTSKEIIVLVLSGGLIPLRFFPEEIRHVLMYLPFQAIYHTPASILTDSSLSVLDYAPMIGVQAFWALALLFAGRMLFGQAVKVVTINGG